MLSSVLNVFCVKLIFACISKVLSLSMVYECVCVCMCVCVCVCACVCVCVCVVCWYDDSKVGPHTVKFWRHVLTIFTYTGIINMIMYFSVAETQYESDLFALATCSDSYRGKTTASM